jgi:hypothetical protein
MGPGTYNSGNAEGAVTFIYQRLEINIGEGNLTWSFTVVFNTTVLMLSVVAALAELADRLAVPARPSWT